MSVLQVVAGPVGRPVLGAPALRHSRTGVSDDGVQDAERREAECSLVRAKVEPVVQRRVQ
jgi:hypothetical protein